MGRRLRFRLSTTFKGVELPTRLQLHMSYGYILTLLQTISVRTNAMYQPDGGVPWWVRDEPAKWMRVGIYDEVVRLRSSAWFVKEDSGSSEGATGVLQQLHPSDDEPEHDQHNGEGQQVGPTT